MSKEYAKHTVEERRANTEETFTPYYTDFWDVKHIADCEENRDELSESESRTAAQLLECADIDTIIDTYDRIITVQEKIITSPKGQRLAIRDENNKPGVAPESTRFKNSTTQPGLTPDIIAVMSIPNGNFEWVRFINANTFITNWVNGNIEPAMPLDNDDPSFNRKLLFNPEDIDNINATITTYTTPLQPTTTTITTTPTTPTTQTPTTPVPDEPTPENTDLTEDQIQKIRNDKYLQLSDFTE